MRSFKSLLTRTNLILIAILLLAFFVRVYRVGDLLGFYYDQGRDALVIWKLWHEGKPFLIGPVTGLPGIFLGPFYYYLIAPFYLMGAGDPIYPAVFLAFVTTVAVWMLYFLGTKMHSEAAGLMAATIGAFSYTIVYNNRWLSNPVPIYLTSLLFLWSLWEIANGGKKYFWPLAYFLAGASLHFESASAIFYIPVLFVFSLWQKRHFPGLRTMVVSVGAFFVTLLPQIIFNFRHENLLLNNFKRLFLEERGFEFTKFLFETRSHFFWEVTTNKIFPGWYPFAAVFFLIVFLALIFGRKTLKKPVLPLFSIFLAVPMLGYYAFRGNHGVVYDYYLSGFFFPFILLFSIGLAEAAKAKMGVATIAIFFGIFLIKNVTTIHSYLSQDGEGPQTVNFKAQMKSIDWVFEDAKTKGEFNIDVYVPPVIPYAYDYLFLWQANVRCPEELCGWQREGLRQTLYTLYEDDPPHPERLQAWLDRQKGIGEVEDQARFAGITVQRRKRL